MQATPDDRTAPPASPCINVCVLDGGGFCIGCLRTGDEIARWRDMSAVEQWRLLDRLAERRAERAAAVKMPSGGEAG
jgi:predicted Fe-S protein YdhL (DUF1289 family)